MDNVDNAIKIAQIFGPFLAIIGLWMLLFSRYLESVWKKVRDQAGPFYAWGALELFVGLVILTQYCEWTSDAFVFITIFGWTMLIKGLGTLFFPRATSALLLSNRHFLHIRGVFPLVLGLILSAVGYVT